MKHRHTLNEVCDVAGGRYDWKIERKRIKDMTNSYDETGYPVLLLCENIPKRNNEVSYIVYVD